MIELTNLELLLYSNDVVNVKLGIELIKSGAAILPPDLIVLLNLMYIELDNYVAIFKLLLLNELNLHDHGLIITELPPVISKTNYKCYRLSFTNITTLKNIPRVINGDLYCNFTLLNTVEHFPSKITGVLRCYGNPIQLTEENVLNMCDISLNNIYI